MHLVVCGLQLAVRSLHFQFKVQVCLCDVDFYLDVAPDFGVASGWQQRAACNLHLGAYSLQLAACACLIVVSVFRS